MFDSLGDRMKNDFEGRTRYLLPRRTYTVIRVDGKSFHTYTKGLKKPFDDSLMEDMDLTATYLCENIMGAKFAYVQSDEISILIADFEDEKTQSWFDSNLQKMCSVSASMATRSFNECRINRLRKALLTIEEGMKWAEFDSRVFQIPSKTEVENYFIWRQQDASRNSVSSVAQSLYSHKELHGKGISEMQELIFQKGQNWNDLAPRYKRGRLICKVPGKKVLCNLQAENMIKKIKKSNPHWFADSSKNEFGVNILKWETIDVPIFTQEKEFLQSKIPTNT